MAITKTRPTARVIKDAAAESKAKVDAAMEAKNARAADEAAKAAAARSKVTAPTTPQLVKPSQIADTAAADFRNPLRPVMPTPRTPAPAMGSMPAGGMNQSPAFKRGGNVRKEKESYSQPSKKNNSVRGWGIARSARKAKIV